MPNPAKRTSHMEHYLVNYGNGRLVPDIVPDRAGAGWVHEDFAIDRHLTESQEYIIEGAFENRAPSISFKFYQDEAPIYWWVIVMFNGIIFPTKELTTGKVIRIPDKTQVDNWLAAMHSSPVAGRQAPAGNRSRLSNVA